VTHPIMTDTTPCKGPCGRLMRPARTRAHEYPGTVPHRAGGYCKACLSKLPPELRPAPRQAAKVTTPKACRSCDHPLRPHDAKIADHPGTLRCIGAGLCSRCWESDGPWALDPEAIRPDFDEAHARAALESWLRRRRKLGLAA
jgi:hypothetical protein